MGNIQQGQRTYQVISRELTKDKYPNFHKRGCVEIVTASFGETLFVIYEFANGGRKTIRAFM